MNFLARLDLVLISTKDVTIEKTVLMDLMKKTVHYYRYLNHMTRHYLLSLVMMKKGRMRFIFKLMLFMLMSLTLFPW